MFSRLIVTDDDSLMCSASPDIGEIKVIIRHTEISAPSHHHVSRWTASGTKRNAPTQITVHERTKKAVDHQTSLGQDIQSQARFIESKPYGPPLLTFRFRYRPIAMLQANGIVPRKRARSQEVELGPEDVIDISSDSDSGELDRLRERIRLLEGRQQERVPKKIKREPSVKRELIVGEVIDLTES
ncbi:hypothetical protein E1B28_010979 [Marasmius oreades]|nr:uncharacterized protein E1B28_010979 [Marasmius oreades]KAG7089281.1 hypothetical protein E1B28_010979 [Marasmius oreades]